MRMVWAAVLIGVAGMSLSACGGEGPDNWAAGRPRIDRLRFVQQTPQDPYALVFSIEFVDTDGDLGAGIVHLLVGDQESATRPVAELFAAASPPVSLEATEGEFEAVARVSKDITVGQKIKIGFILVDGASHESNDPSLMLQAFMPGGI